MLVDVLAVIASGVFLVRLVPQPVRLARSGVAAGVSPLAALNAVIAASAWTIYGVVAALPAVWIVSLLALVPGVWTVVLLGRSVQRSDLVWAGAWITVIALAATAGVLGVALAFTVGVTNAPQVRRVFVESDPSGVAPGTWCVALLDATTWGAYGIALGDGALVGYAVVLLVSAALVLARLGRLGEWSPFTRSGTVATVSS